MIMQMESLKPLQHKCNFLALYIFYPYTKFHHHSSGSSVQETFLKFVFYAYIIRDQKCHDRCLRRL